MKLKELEANVYAHLRAKLSHIKRGFLDFRPTNEDYINKRISELNIPQLIERFGPEADVGKTYLYYNLPEELPSAIIIEAVREMEGQTRYECSLGIPCDECEKRPCDLPDKSVGLP